MKLHFAEILMQLLSIIHVFQSFQFLIIITKAIIMIVMIRILSLLL